MNKLLVLISASLLFCGHVNAATFLQVADDRVAQSQQAEAAATQARSEAEKAKAAAETANAAATEASIKAQEDASQFTVQFLALPDTDPSKKAAKSNTQKAADDAESKKAAAQAATENADKKLADAQAAEAKAKGKKDDLISTWGLSFGAAVEHYKDKYIDKASTHGDTQIVTIDDSFNSSPSLWAVGRWTYVNPTSTGFVRPGLFFGFKFLGQDEKALDSFAIGFNFALLEDVIVTDKTGATTHSKMPTWNIGFGWVNHQTQKLAKGIEEGQPLPAHFDDVDLENSTENSWLIMVSKNVDLTPQ